MSKYRSAGYRKAVRGSKIRAWLHHKQMAALIPENKNICTPRVKAEWIIRLEHSSGARSSFRIYRTPFGISISPTMAGRKVACVIKNFK
jgi:hypothetical protein